MVKRRFRLGRVLGVVAGLALATQLFYLVVANVVLGTFLTRWINTNPEDLSLDYGRAWSPWPGRVYVHDFDLVVQDENVQFELILPHAELDISLASLLRKTVRLTHLDTQGVRFLFRHKLRGLRGNDRHLAALPPISGLTEPAVIHEKPAGPPGAPWKIHITGIDAEVTELWFQEYRYLGHGRTQGGFEFVPEQRLRIVPSTLSLEPGSLHVGEKLRISRDFAAQLATTIEDLDIQRKKGRNVLEAISARVSLRTELENVAFSRLYFPHDSKLALLHGAGPLDVHIDMTHGHLQPGSRVDYRTREVALRTPRLSLQGDASLRLEVTRHQQGKLLVRASELAFGANGRPRAVQARRAELWLGARMHGLHESWRTPDAFLVLPEIRADDLRALNAFVGPKVELSGGPAQAFARADLDASGALSGELALDFSSTVARFGQSRASGSGRFEMALQKPKARGSEGRFERVWLGVDRAQLLTRTGRTGLGWVRASAASIPFHGYVPVRLDIKVQAGFPAALPVLSAAGVRLHGVPGALAKHLNLSDLKVQAAIAHAGENTQVDLERVWTHAVHGEGKWRSSPGNERGAFLLAGSLMNVGVERSAGKTHVRLFASHSWLSHALADLDLNRPLPSPPPAGNLGPRPGPARFRP